ncbi:MAG: hypothetical protein M1574_00850 [Gammaproteobacteria bacterium]|nr:hypothetical protein [Gammaproteobacteria bacterium]
MKRTSRPRFPLQAGLALGMVLVLAAPALASPPAAARLSHLERRMGVLRRTLARERKTRAQIRMLLVRTRREIRGVRAALSRLEAQETTLSRRTRTLERQQSAARAALAARRGDFALLARTRYVLGPEARLHLLLDTLRHPGRDTRLLADFGILAAREERRLAILRASVTRLVLLLGRLRARELELASVRARKTTQLLHLAAVHAQRHALLAALQGKITRHGALLNLLLARARVLSGLLGRLDHALQTIPWASGIPLAFPRLRGALPWPAQGQLVRVFGQPHASGVGVWHGVLIAARRMDALLWPSPRGLPRAGLLHDLRSRIGGLPPGWGLGEHGRASGQRRSKRRGTAPRALFRHPPWRPSPRPPALAHARAPVNERLD